MTNSSNFHPPTQAPQSVMDDVLSRLDAVRQMGSGWRARCPAHEDRTPSLSIHEGIRGALLRCFAGCTLTDICTALHMVPADLFYDAPVPRGARPAPKPIPKDPRSTAFEFELAALDLRLRSERIFEAAKHIDVASLDDADLDRALSHVAQGYHDLDRADLLEGVADNLRDRFGQERV
jgi:hypothetical protein